MAIDDQNEKDATLINFFKTLETNSTIEVSDQTKKEANELGITLSNKIKTTSQEEAENGDAIVCAYPHMSCFDNDVKTICDFCGQDIIHRPHAPLGPPKICLDCVIGVAELEKEFDAENFTDLSREFLKRKKRKSDAF